MSAEPRIVRIDTRWPTWPTIAWDALRTFLPDGALDPALGNLWYDRDHRRAFVKYTGPPSLLMNPRTYDRITNHGPSPYPPYGLPNDADDPDLYWSFQKGPLVEIVRSPVVFREVADHEIIISDEEMPHA